MKGSRDAILSSVRAALGRSSGQAPGEIPPSRIRIPDRPASERSAMFSAALEKLNGKAYSAESKQDARAYAERLLAGKSAVASNAGFLRDCGILEIAGVAPAGTDATHLRKLCSSRDVGITSADFALADTGTLVLFSSTEEARLISLLPPCHLAVVPAERLLSGLDELLEAVPLPASRSSSMVFITGPSRTADIEQILVRGVHGPGEIHVVLV